MECQPWIKKPWFINWREYSTSSDSWIFQWCWYPPIKQPRGLWIQDWHWLFDLIIFSMYVSLNWFDLLGIALFWLCFDSILFDGCFHSLILMSFAVYHSKRTCKSKPFHFTTKHRWNRVSYGQWCVLPFEVIVYHRLHIPFILTLKTFPQPGPCKLLSLVKAGCLSRASLGQHWGNLEQSNNNGIAPRGYPNS